MANARTLIELRREGFVTAECDRRMGPRLVKDWYGFGDVTGYDPTRIRRFRVVNGCLDDVQDHIKKYLEGGIKENGDQFPPNPHLIHMIALGWDLYIYSFVKRGARGKRKLWECRKWQAILSPEGKVSFIPPTEKEIT